MNTPIFTRQTRERIKQSIDAETLAYVEALEETVRQARRLFASLEDQSQSRIRLARALSKVEFLED